MSRREYQNSPAFQTNEPIHPSRRRGDTLVTFQRKLEVPPLFTSENHSFITASSRFEAIESSSLTRGSRDLLYGLLETGCTKTFPGGGVGVEYGALLKTAARPDVIAGHISEAADHLQEKNVDIIFAPGMSGHPYASMVSLESRIPAVLLKKERHDTDPTHFPPGAFRIPSYTGEGNVIISADMEAVQHIVDSVLNKKLQADPDETEITIRQAGADDIIDKATMSTAVCSQTDHITHSAVDDYFHRYFRENPADNRSFSVSVESAAFVTPLMKGYNSPQEELESKFGFQPFAGLTITSVHLKPSAIGIEGVGIFEFSERSQAPTENDVFHTTAAV